MPFRHFAWSRRTDPRDIVRRAGGLWFVDILEQIDKRLSGSPRNVRAAFAAWSAEHALSASPAIGAEVQAARTVWVSALAQVWDALEAGGAQPPTELAAALDSATEEGSGPEWDALDDDGVAACIYAVQSYVTADPEAPRWAAQRAVDAAFAVDAAVARSPKVDRPEDLAEDALRPRVQELLRAMERTLDLLAAKGVSPDVLLALRNRAR